MQLTRDNLYIHIPIFKLFEYLEQFLTLNLNCEIYIDSDFIDNYSAKDIDLINAGFEKYGLNKKIHGPFSDLNPGSVDKGIREITLKRFLEGLELCVELRADSMVLHSHFEPIFYGRHFDEWLNNSKEVWEGLGTEAKKRNISVYIENSIDNSPRAILEILKAHPYLGACFDVAHYNVFSPQGWKNALKDYPIGSIKEVHLSDNKGDEDKHLPLGEGSIDFKEFFNAIETRNENPIFTVEPHSPQDLAKCLEYIRQLG